MKIYSPTPSCFFVQGYGIKGTSPSMLKTYKDMGLRLGHNGLDFGVMCKDNQVHHNGQCESVFMNVAGVGDLKVFSVSRDENQGYGINAIDSVGNKYCWWHFDILNPLMFVGNTIKFGQVLGVAGNTGISTGAHCHFGYYPVVGFDEGMGGAGDPTPYFENRFCGDVSTQIMIIQKLLDIYKGLLSLIKK